MNGIRSVLIPAVLAMAVTACFAAIVPAEEVSPWQPPEGAEVRQQVFVWLETQAIDDAVRTRVEGLWPATEEEPTAGVLFDRLCKTAAAVDARAEALLALCSKPRTELVPPPQAWLADEKTPPLVANNLRVLFARWLAGEHLYDEAGEQLAGLEPGDVVDPATLLFYQSVIHHQLLDTEGGLKTIDRLLDGSEHSPQRYVSVAMLMKEDLGTIKKVDSLGHIARRMKDIERRLDLGRAGPRVRKVEDGVIESLDKLIKELEEQQNQSGGTGSGNIQSSRPAQDSQIMGGRGPGEVTKRNIGSKSDWGNLPEKEREEAMQAIGEDFPAHYRDIIEEYFRRLAATEGE